MSNAFGPLLKPMPDNYQLVETRLQQPLENGDVVCNLCLWRCRLRHGQRGFCQAHVNRNGTLYNLSYGIISAFSRDKMFARRTGNSRSNG